MFLDFLDFPVATVHHSDITKSEKEVSDLVANISYPKNSEESVLSIELLMRAIRLAWSSRS